MMSPMTPVVFAQALGEYGGSSAFGASIGQAWDRVMLRLGSVDSTTWGIVGGVALLVLVLWGRRSSNR
jgi:hypothetical protein